MSDYDLIIRHGLIYDGSGAAPFVGDVAVNGDTIAAVGRLGDAKGGVEVDAAGLVVAPGFINMLSWAVESLIEDGRSQSDIRQGVTLEVMGEGLSMGPLSEAMKAEGPRIYLAQGDVKYDVEWTTLGEYLEFLERRGVSTNVASFVGSSTVRIHAVGYDHRPPDDEEMDAMRSLVRQAMEEGAMGLSAALIYPPAFFADIDELIELASVVAEYDGLYISHVRGEGRTLLDALDELIEISEAAQVRAEIYHLKAAGPSNWGKMDQAIALIEEARARDLPITADMYTYPYGGTGLNSCLPPWTHEGGHEAMIARLKDPETRERIRQEMLLDSDEWENMFVQNGPENILLSGFRQEALKPLTGKRLAEVAAMRGTSPEDTLMDLIIEDDSRIFTLYFTMSEDNVRKQMALPWVSFCSDAESLAPEGVFLRSNPHPRAYGSFARVIGKYVRDEKVIPLEEAIRRLTSFPAQNLRLDRRGWLKADHFADVVVFDPALVQDHATPEQPHQYATGMVHVFVNGVQVLKDGEHTGAKPGRVVRGPGWQKRPFESSYPPPVGRFLALGKDYNGTYFEFDITHQHVPDLIRMATDMRLYTIFEESRPEQWAPMHAQRRLGQLGAKEAAQPLTSLFTMFDPQMMQELRTVYGMIGAPAIPTLAAYLEDLTRPSYARVLCASCLAGIADANPDLVDLCEIALVERLEKHEEETPTLNGMLVRLLVQMDTRQTAAMQAAYEAGHVDESIAGTWKDNMVKLGLRPSDTLRAELSTTFDDYDDEDEEDSLKPAPARKSADSKKKTKRKQAARSKKLNRKKHR